MTRPKLLLSALCLTTALACAATAALAKASESMPEQTGQPAQPQAISGQQAAAAAALSQVMQQAADQQNKATVASFGAAAKNAQPAAPTPKSGSGKAVYGDIIIHK